MTSKVIHRVQIGDVKIHQCGHHADGNARFFQARKCFQDSSEGIPPAADSVVILFHAVQGNAHVRQPGVPDLFHLLVVHEPAVGDDIHQNAMIVQVTGDFSHP